MHTFSNAHAFSFYIIYWQMLVAHSRFGGYINTHTYWESVKLPETLDKQKKMERCDGKGYSSESSVKSRFIHHVLEQLAEPIIASGHWTDWPTCIHTLPFWKLVWREEREVWIWGGPAHTIGTSKLNFSGKHLTYVNCPVFNQHCNFTSVSARKMYIKPSWMTRWLAALFVQVSLNQAWF